MKPKRKEPPTRDVVVTVRDTGRMASVVKSLRKKGAVVEQVLEFTGNVLAKYDGDLANLRKIDGVAEAAESRRDYTPQD